MPVGYAYREYRSAAEKGSLSSGCTNPGDKYRFEYVREDDENGVPHLVITDKIDIQEEINSAEPPSVSALINRYLRGDRSVLGDDSNAIYGDFSHIGDLETVADSGFLYQQAVNAAVVAQSEPVQEKSNEVVENG